MLLRGALPRGGPSWTASSLAPRSNNKSHCEKRRDEAIHFTPRCRKNLNTMPDLIYLGKITAAQGIQGEVRVHSYTDPIEALVTYPLFTEAGDPTPALTLIRTKGESILICKVEGITDRNGAEKLKNLKLYTHRENFDDLDAEDDYYVQDLVGLTVKDETGKPLGKITHVHNFGAGDFFDIQLLDQSLATLPFSSDAVLSVDLEMQEITIDPEMLLMMEKGED